MSTNYSYGNKGVTSCKFCNEELTWEHPGKIAKWISGDKIYEETICNKCLSEDPDYADDCNVLNDYPNTYDVI